MARYADTPEDQEECLRCSHERMEHSEDQCHACDCDGFVDG